MKKIEIITGATGFLGRHFLKELIKDDSSKIYNLVRGSNNQIAKKRLLSILNFTNIDAIVFKCAIDQVNCGLYDEDLNTLKKEIGQKVFWHIAASLAWELGKKDEIFATNVSGTENALKLAYEIGCSKFIYVSTAYTCGEQQGTILEKNHSLNTKTNNEYEKSKLRAENIVKEFCEKKGIDYIIMRPAIVIGNSLTFDAVGSTTGLYGFINQLRRFGSRLQDDKNVHNFYVEESAKLSFIPIDFIIEAMMEIRKLSMTKNIYHLTPLITESTGSIGEIVQYILKKLNLDEKIILKSKPIDNPTSLEKMLDRRLEFYKSYLRTSKNFQTSLPTDLHKQIDFEILKKFIDAELKNKEDCI